MNDTSDWFTVESISTDTHQITEFEPVLRVNSFVIDGGDEALLVDTGMGIGDLRTVVEDLAGSNVRVLLTHSHWDHLGGAHQFDDIVINETERTADGTVRYDFLPGDNEERPQTFMGRWLDHGGPLPDSFDPEQYGIDPIPDVGTVEPGEELVVGDKRLEVVPIPGHTPGMLGVLDRDAKLMHIADLLESTDSGGYELLAHFESSDFEAFVESIERLIRYRDEGAFEAMTQTHGEPIRDLSVLDDARHTLEAVANDEVDYERVDHPLGPIRKHHVENITVSIRDE